MVFALTSLTPESTYLQEAILITFLGAGLGIVMPVMNLAVQNEFAQKQLGAATSSNQLFRSLGSTIGVAIFGAMLTGGITTALGDEIKNDAYVQTLSQSPVANKIGDLDDSNTLLTLNTPDVKKKIRDGFEDGISKLPEQAKEKATNSFVKSQEEYSSKITHAFSTSLHSIFMLAAGLMLAGTVLVFSLKERPLQSAKPDDTPGLA